MNTRLASALAAVSYCMVCLPAIALGPLSEPIEEDRGIWVPLQIRFPIRKRIHGYLEVQPRWQRNHVSQFSESLIRTGIGYEFNKRWSVMGGYYYSARFDPELNHENRLWQQISHVRKFGALTIQNRMRLEQTWRQTYEGASWRVRHQFRATRAIGRTPYYLALSEEPFFNLNTPQSGPVRGFAQNRLILAVGKRVNPYARIELGYMNQYRNSQEPKPDVMNHAFVAQISLDFTSLRKPQMKMARAIQRSRVAF